VLLRAASLVALALALAACGGSGGGTTTQAQSNLPVGCDAAQVHTIVTGFLAHPSVAPPGMFRSYSERESDGRRFSTRNGAAAVAHARARLRLGEVDRLLALQVGPVDVNHVLVVFTLTRSAPDFARRGIHTRIASGNGLVDCAHEKIAGWMVKGP
jgi:hypothetical protein